MDFFAFANAQKQEFTWNFTDKYFSLNARAKLKNRNFTILCNNCVASGIYHKFGLKYTTPTIGLFFFSEDYIKFLENPRWYLNQPFKFSNSSVLHPSANELMAKTHVYPVATVGDIEVHFLHYTTAQEAMDKWMRRVKRINWDDLFIIYSDGAGVAAGAEYDFKEEYFQRFLKLPYKNKVFFSAKPREGCAVLVEEFKGHECVWDSTKSRVYEKYFDVTAWLNGEGICNKKPLMYLRHPLSR
ncbi:MAG: DUF1919 domain-containing protein [Candidatus Bathyarchaeota archaeon]|nr:DUF1919 domain-containing protein [Candidatus Bathyarchaeota archaeon]